jgi:hypothetical protein
MEHGLGMRNESVEHLHDFSNAHLKAVQGVQEFPNLPNGQTHHRAQVQPWEMVENSISPRERIPGGLYPHSTLQMGGFIFSTHAPVPAFRFILPPPANFMWRLLTSFTLIVRSVAPVARDNRAPPELSIVGWFFPLPELPYAVDSVARSACHLALADARAPLVVLHGDAQSDNRLATIPDEPAGVGPAGR